MENKNDRYDFSYFEDDTPYVSHRNRESASKDSESERQSSRLRQERRSERPRKNNKPKIPALTKGRPLIITAGVVAVILIVGIILLIGGISSSVKNGALKASGITDTGVAFEWESRKNVDGYSIYAKEKGEIDYSLMENITDPAATGVTVEALEQATEYSFYIASVKNGKENMFGVAEKITTLPSPPAITSTASESEDSIHVEWNQNAIADGYVLEYKITNADYNPQQRMSFDKEQTSCDISGLQNESYTIRMYSYIGKKDPVISPPSEEQTIMVGKKQTASGATFFDPNIDPDKPMVAFTFDDGPFDGVYSDRILDALEKYKVTATFFMVGCYVEDHPENLKRKVELNMELGNHTWDHSKYGEGITAEDISRCSDAIFNVTGRRPTAFRPPGGAQSDVILNEATAEGMPIYLWNVNSEDYETHNADAIYNMVMGSLGDGNIIGMHDTYEATAEAVERMIPEILSQGYQIVSAHDLVLAKTGKEPVAGEIYYDFAENNYDE